MVIMPFCDGRLDVLAQPNTRRYPGRRLLIVTWDSYVYLVPCVEKSENFFLKAVIPKPEGNTRLP